MRATVVFAFVFAFVASLVGAASVPSHGLNARRLARGLGPLPPVRRSPTKVAGTYCYMRRWKRGLREYVQLQPGRNPLVPPSATPARFSAVCSPTPLNLTTFDP